MVGRRGQEHLGRLQIMGKDESSHEPSAQFLPDRPHPGTLLVQSVMKEHLLVAVDGSQPDDFDTSLFPLEGDVDVQDAEVVEREQVVQQGDNFPAGYPRELFVALPERLERRCDPGEDPQAHRIRLKLSNEESNGADRLELVITGRAIGFTTLLFYGSKQPVDQGRAFVELFDTSVCGQNFSPSSQPLWLRDISLCRAQQSALSTISSDGAALPRRYLAYPFPFLLQENESFIEYQ